VHYHTWFINQDGVLPTFPPGLALNIDHPDLHLLSISNYRQESDRVSMLPRWTWNSWAQVILLPQTAE
jgi:hypothetical protein